MIIKSLLKYIRKYVDLTDEEEFILASHVICRKYLKGQYILQQGDVCKYQCFVISGCVKTFFIDAEGQEHVMTFSIEDWWTTDMSSFINQTPADFNIQCLQNSELVIFTKEIMEVLFDEIPKLERFFRQILEGGLAASEKRLIRNFSQSAKERYLYFRKQYPKIEQRIPQYMIASYLGITKEFLSKIKNQLAIEDKNIKLD